MLSFEQKLAIIEAFPELQRKNVSLGRTNFHYEESLYEKKSVVHHLHPNGNGYVFAGLVPGVATDEKGLVNIRDYSEDELRSLIEKAIQALALAPPEKPESKKKKKTSLRRKNAGSDRITPFLRCCSRKTSGTYMLI